MSKQRALRYTRVTSARSRRAAVALGVTAVAGLVIEAIASCGSTPQTNPPDTGAPVHIGVVIALSGDLKGTGVSLQNAARVAEQQINAYGGVLGRHVTYDIQDDQTDTGQIIKGVVSTLLGQHVSAILGPIGSGQVSAVQKLTYDAKTIEISATATSPILSTNQPANDRYFFRTVPNDNLQAEALAIFAYNGPGSVSDGGVPVSDAGSVDGGDAGSGPPPGGGCRTMAIIHNNDDYGNPFATALTTNFEARAGVGAVVVNQAIPTDVQPGYDAQLVAVQTAAPDCLAMIVYDPAGDGILRQLRQYQSQGKISNNLVVIGTDGTFTNDFIVNGQANKGSTSSPSVAEGVYGTNPDPNPSERGEYGDFKKLYLAQFSLDPGATDLPGQAANFYDAAILAALAIQKAGSTDDPVKIRDALFAVSKGTVGASNTQLVGPGLIGDALSDLQQGKDINYQGASGDVDFDPTGDVVGNYIIWHVKHDTGSLPAFETVGKISASQLGTGQ